MPVGKGRIALRPCSGHNFVGWSNDVRVVSGLIGSAMAMARTPNRRIISAAKVALFGCSLLLTNKWMESM